MRVMQAVVAGAVVSVWFTGFFMAYFIDRSLISLVSESREVMVIVAIFLFGPGAIDMLRGRKD